MQVFPYNEVAAKDAEKGALDLKVRWLITKEMGAENFGMRLFEIAPGGYSPFHSHPWEHEVFVLDGEGVVVGKEHEKRFGADDVIFILPNEKHQFRNTGETSLKFLCIVPMHE